MKPLLPLLLWGLLSGPVCAEDFTVGETKLAIPAPQGFQLVTPDMATVYQFAKQIAASTPDSEQLGFYIPEDEVPAALKGELTPRRKTFFLRVSQIRVPEIVSEESFEEIMFNTKEDNQQIIQNVRAQNPDQFDDMLEQAKQQSGPEIELQLSQFLPFKEHYETSQAMSFSMLYAMNVTDGVRSMTETKACTMTYLNPAGKLLTLVCYAPQDELEWTRTASKAWTQAILKQNAPAPELSKESQRKYDEQEKNRQNIAKMLLAALLLVMCLAYLFRTNRPKPA